MLVGIEGGYAADAPLPGLIDPAIWRIGLDASLGKSALVTIAGPALLVIGLWRGRVVPLAAGAVPAIAALALTGHIATAQPRWLKISALLLHAGLAAFWVGALVPLDRRLGSETHDMAADIVTRFANAALILVPSLLAAGLTIATVQVETPAAMLPTQYDDRLLIKLGLVAVLLSFAAFNKIRLTPILRRGDPGGIRLLRAVIGIEGVIALGVLTATASLGQVTPPRAVPSALHQPAPAITVTARANGYVARIDLIPSHRGDNCMTMTLTSQDGTPVRSRAVSAWVSSPDLGIEASGWDLAQGLDGRFVLDRLVLPIAGNWTIEIDARLTEFKQRVFTATVSLP